VAAGKKYVDVNVFVYWLGNHPTLGKIAKEWIRDVERSAKGSYVTSSLTVYEVLIVMSGLTGNSLENKRFVEKVLEAIFGLRGLEISPIIKSDFTSALEYMGKYGLDLEDALHLTVALREKAVEIVSNDKDFDKTPLRRIF